MLMWALLCVFILSAEAVTTGTNVDILEPTVIRSPAAANDSEDGFGWAVLLHQIQPLLEGDSMNTALMKTRVLVGAPSGSYSGGLNLTDPEEPASTNTGLVYSCPLGGVCEGVRGNTSLYLGGDANITNGVQGRFGVPTASSRVFFLPAISEGRLFDQAPDSMAPAEFTGLFVRVERKSHQRMGSVLYSNGDTIVACAPGWVHSPATARPVSQPRGICFSGDRQLSNFKSEFPCIGRGFQGSARENGYCLAGSVAIAADRIHIGAPGYEDFSGAVFSRSLEADYTSLFTRTTNHLNEGRTAESGTTTTTYHGIEVSSGYITSNNRTESPPNLLVAASRDDETTYIGKIYMYNSTTLGTFQRIPVAEGRQMAEFFGYSVATADLTGDDYDELLVGAPMYTGISAQPGIQPESGRLYVFFNTGGSLDPAPVILEGDGVAHSRFGFTVANLGDIDADGFEDLAVSAPYERSQTSENTGAVYIYYGRQSRGEFESQTPLKIHSDEIVDAVEGLTRFRTFGFGLSGNVDVDNNGYKDLVVGGYLDQVVVMLRSVPVATVTVGFRPIPAIRVDVADPSFEVTLTARFEGVQLTGPLDVPFTLSEVPLGGEFRLFFTNGTQHSGVFNLPGPNVVVEQNVTVYALSDFTEIRPYSLLLDLEDIPRTPAAVVDGQQPITDLSAFPSIRQSGENVAMINLINPCGDDGCSSDLALSLTTPPTPIVLIQGQDRSLSFSLTYTNIGTDEARTLRLNISNFPDGVFQQISLSPEGQEGFFDCPVVDGGVLCSLRNRFLANRSRTVLLKMVVDKNGFVGNEEDFSLNLDLLIDVSGNNTDEDLSNNRISIAFALRSEEDINVAVSLGSPQHSYTGVAPGPITSSNNLGGLVTLQVTVGNSGPSTIQNARVNISFPSRVQGSDSLFYLYPSRVVSQISGSPQPSITCSTEGIDPNDYTEEKFTVSSQASARRKRSIRTTGFRVKRQNQGERDFISCSSRVCVNLLCDVQRLSTRAVSITVEFNIDERFYSSSGGGRNYTIEVMAATFVGDDFQARDDNPRDNSATASTVLFQVKGEDSSLLIHAIVWPAVAAVILLFLFVLLLYYVGFFKRKSPAEEEEEPEPFAPALEPSSKEVEAEITGL